MLDCLKEGVESAQHQQAATSVVFVNTPHLLQLGNRNYKYEHEYCAINQYVISLVNEY